MGLHVYQVSLHIQMSVIDIQVLSLDSCLFLFRLFFLLLITILQIMIKNLCIVVKSFQINAAVLWLLLLLHLKLAWDVKLMLWFVCLNDYVVFRIIVWLTLFSVLELYLASLRHNLLSLLADTSAFSNRGFRDSIFHHGNRSFTPDFRHFWRGWELL